MSESHEQRIHKLEELMTINELQHAEMIKLMRPISETYTTVGRMSKWIMALLVFLSVLGGVVWTWGNILKK
jgi:hypothetical protein